LKRALAAAALVCLACQAQSGTVLLMVVSVSGSAPGVTALGVTLTGEAGNADQTYPGPGGRAIVFPTTLAADLPARITGDLTVDIRATNAAGDTVARGQAGPFTLRVGARQTVEVRLDCAGAPCAVDGGAGDGPPGPDAGTDAAPSCGNGRIDPGETCDTAIPPGAPLSCPAAGDCDDADPCTRDQLISAGTCAAICLHVPITTQSGGAADGCCPAGAFHAVDVDCPVACGNGLVEEGETCDLGLPAGGGGCPTSCDDGDPCTVDFLDGAPCHATCAHLPIAARVSGDGCCPPGADRTTDGDCPAACGNGVVEPGESCDNGNGKNGSAAPCPTSCPPAPSACVQRTLVGTAAACSARCQTTVVTACAAASDGCCPAGCTAATDPDCSPTCGNGVVEGPRETCDTAIAAGRPGACPTNCADANPCTQDLLIGAGTCAAACLSLPVTTFRAGDGCCPPAGSFLVDADCAPLCGNGVVEAPVESCDGACPAVCPAGGACLRVALEGAATSCNARCAATPVVACAGGDGCCPAGCTALTDADCPAVCGDGLLEPGERCDRGVTAGQPGACAPTCDDGDACTSDFTSGSDVGCSRVCTHVAVTACASGDGCCPAGCTALVDRDCGVMCGDGRIEAGETCDPPSSCPIACPDDGDRCTAERLTGDANHCNVSCRHVPITACSGRTADLCCPTGCTPATDVDCN